jgi:hypothetical protein
MERADYIGIVFAINNQIISDQIMTDSSVIRSYLRYVYAATFEKILADTVFSGNGLSYDGAGSTVFCLYTK